MRGQGENPAPHFISTRQAHSKTGLDSFFGRSSKFFVATSVGGGTLFLPTDFAQPHRPKFLRGRGENPAPHFIYTRQAPPRLAGQFFWTIVQIFCRHKCRRRNPFFAHRLRATAPTQVFARPRLKPGSAFLLHPPSPSQTGWTIFLDDRPNFLSPQM